jgi:hypothetical protein
MHYERLMGVLPHLYPADKVVSADFMGYPLKVGTGLHDNSAALIPYLGTFQEPFALISTSTWCISCVHFYCFLIVTCLPVFQTVAAGPFLGTKGKQAANSL